MGELHVAETIYQQMGGHRFRVMTGSRDFLGFEAGTIEGIRTPAGLVFRVGRNSGGVGKCRIGLDEGTDTYTVTFYSTRHKITGEYSDVYCDQLRPLFERVTGLVTSLGTMGARA